MVEAFKNEIICPNKHVDPLTKFHNGHLLESETYIGGHVECLETGVYRSDIPCSFNLVPSALQGLIDNIDRDLTFFIEIEKGMKKSTITNYDEVRSEIVKKLEALRDNPNRKEEPYIYHLDVGAMYPNIILTNRLQPGAIVDEATCAACDFNQESNKCKRKMDWIWRGDFAPATKSEYNRTKMQLSQLNEKVNDKPFLEYSHKEQADIVAKRVKMYSHKVYKKSKETKEEPKQETVCMRENSFYVDMVRKFRDRRYDFKRETRKWKGKAKAAVKGGNAVEIKHAQDMSLVYDSLQVAHKCILNSFYGYVMRKGARWRSMEMAGIVTLTGARLITQARELVEQVGRPLELDTDGIWCILPRSFPDVFTFTTAEGGKENIEYPCCMLNSDVHDRYTNHQYQTLDGKEKTYNTHSECSIFFEVDGPYKAMILPASTEEGKLLKKRYAVYNFDGSLAELKGFELKRRGELELIKAFQGEVFVHFLDGKSLDECYGAVAEIANHWLDVLDNCGDALETDELIGLISENRSMSRQLEDYGEQKSTSLTTAKRLGEFLGKEMVQDKGLVCKFIIADKPHGAPVTERAIPTAIWQAEPAVMKTYLRKWLKDNTLDDFDIRSILDWDYYRERLAKNIQKIITIPAALQRVENPVPRVIHPDWLSKLVRSQNDVQKQVAISSMFNKLAKGEKAKGQFGNASGAVADIEDTLSLVGAAKKASYKGMKKATVTKALVTVTPDRNLPPPSLNREGDFQRWLKLRKSQWKAARTELKRQRTHSLMRDFKSSSSDAPRKKRKVGVEGFLKEAAQSLSQGIWQVVELRESDAPGEYVLYVMTNQKAIQRIPLTVPRRIYVDLKGDGGGKLDVIKQSSKSRLMKDWFLPHNQAANQVFEIVMSERRFIQQKENLAGSTDVQGIYAMETPLIFETLVKMGNVARVSRMKANSNKSFNLDDLEGIQKPDFTYLHDSVASFRRIFYFQKCPSSDRGVISLFFMSSPGGGSAEPVPSSVDMTARCMMWIVKPSKNKQHEVTRSHCSSFFQSLLNYVKVTEDVCQAEREWYNTLVETSTCTFDLNFVNSEGRAMREANAALMNYIQEKNGPTFLVTKSSKNLAELKPVVTSLSAFPVVSFADDTAPLNALGWEKPAATAAIASFVNMGALDFPRRLAAARYSKIPLCNLGARETEVMYDIFFARQLKKARSLTWASNDPRPDLGYVGGGDSGRSQGLFDDDDIMIEVSKEGAYRSICFQIEVKGLAAVAMRNLDIDDGSLAMDAGGELGDEAAVGRAFKALQALVGVWWRESEANGNVIAEGILSNFYKLICSPESLLYDPTMKRVLGAQMHKTFSMLVGELQHLGAKVVFADFYKVIIATNKVDLGASLEYVDFLINTIKSYGDIFSQLNLKVSRVWSDLLFLDVNNFEAVEFERQDPAEMENEGEGESRVVVARNETFAWHMCSNWNLVHFMGDDMHKHYFRSIVGRFSRIMFERRTALLQRKEEDMAVDVESEMLEVKRKYVGKQIASTFTKYLGDILANSFEVEWPDLPGSHLTPASPALDFVRSVIKVFSLDSDVVNETAVLRKSALTQIGMHEYSEESKWVDPCNSFILPNVFCEHCECCTNLNLCVVNSGDDEEEAEVGEDGSPLQRSDVLGWSCEECKGRYDMDFIEWRLVEMMQIKSTQFLAQDFRCPKTNAVAKGLMTRTSEVSIPYEGDFDRVSFLKELSILKRVAKAHQMEWLGETVDNLLS